MRELYPAPAARPAAQPGDLWVLGPHRVVCGDATDPGMVGLALDGARPFLMVTDPPYGVSYDPAWRAGILGQHGTSLLTVANDDRADWREAWALFPGDVVYVWHGALFGSASQDALRAAGFLVRSHIVWRKQHFAISRGAYHWQHEACWYAVRKGRTAGWTGDRKQRSVWDIANATGWRTIDDGRTGHATQKPLECMRRPMLNHTRPDGLVYDPFPERKGERNPYEPLPDDVAARVIPVLAQQTGLKTGTMERALHGMVIGTSYVIKSRGGDVSLRYFGAHETGQGVSAAPWNRRQIYPGTFMMGGRFPNRVPLSRLNGQVMKRVGSRRLPIIKQRSGLFIPKEMVTGASAATFRRTVAAELPSRLEAELRRLLGGS